MTCKEKEKVLDQMTAEIVNNPVKRVVMWIRPVYAQGSRLISFALCRSNGEMLVDNQIVEHFETDDTGVEIKMVAKEFHGATEVVWGKPIDVL